MAPLTIRKLSISSLVFFLTYVDCQMATPQIAKFITEPTDVQIESGATINLQCVFDQPASNCYWLKNGIAETPQFIGNKFNGNCSIRLVGNDEVQGNWQCGIPPNGPMDNVLSKAAKVTVIGSTTSLRTGLKASPQRDVFVQEPEDTTVRTGDNTIIKCIFKTDQPLPLESCYWEKDGGVIQMGGRYSLDGNLQQGGDCSVTITKANLKLDDGLWYCGLPQSDSFGRAVTSRKANVTVAVAPSNPKILKDNVEQLSGSSIGVQFGQPFVVTCGADNGNPEATLKWTIAGTELPGDVRVSSGMSSKLKSVKNELRITALNEWKGQQLTCTSSHPMYDVGQERTTSVILTDLQKTSTASITCLNSTDSKRTITLKANEKAEFTCNGDGIPVPEYRWQVLTNDKWQKLMDNIQNLTVYSKSQQIRCVASNDGFNGYAYSQTWTIVGTETSGTNSITGTRLMAFILSIWIVKHVLN